MALRLNDLRDIDELGALLSLLLISLILLPALFDDLVDADWGE